MKANIKKLDVEMELKNKGMEIEVRDTNDEFKGDLVISKSGVIWCKGKVQRKNGVKKSWDELIALFDNE